MEKGKTKESAINRLTGTQLKQKVIYLQAELLKYKRKLKSYKKNEKYKDVNKLKSERDKLDYLLKQQQEINAELEQKYDKLKAENEKYKEQSSSHQKSSNSKNMQESKKEEKANIAILTEKVNSFSEQLGHCIKNYVENEKRLVNHDKELAKIELLLNRMEDYSKHKVEEQLLTLKTKVTAIEEKIMNEGNNHTN
jgi:chromosome segregation ATPase